mmetsp:Transcript_7606/g.18721  ORF Transcript_7606/g.18721 Transcript_7606/m.18721 type:complete len:216 (-) Transcript_7606:470-1117(-)
MLLISARDCGFVSLSGDRGETSTGSFSSMSTRFPVWQVRGSVRGGVSSSADISCVVPVVLLKESDIDSSNALIWSGLFFLPFRFSSRLKAENGDELRGARFLLGFALRDGRSLPSSSLSLPEESREESSESQSSTGAILSRRSSFHFFVSFATIPKVSTGFSSVVSTRGAFSPFLTFTHMYHSRLRNICTSLRPLGNSCLFVTAFPLTSSNSSPM